MSQLRSDLWCAAFIRRHNDLGELAVVARRGDPIAGQVWIEVDHLDGTVTLYAPAPAPYYTERTADRLFEPRLSRVPADEARDRLERESRFDSDFWLIALETRAKDYGIETISDASKK
jgi:hypothetical protein